jgi:hypothetical protein
MDWINLAQDRGPVEGFCEHSNEPSGSWVAVWLKACRERLSSMKLVNLVSYVYSQRSSRNFFLSAFLPDSSLAYTESELILAVLKFQIYLWRFIWWGLGSGQWNLHDCPIFHLRKLKFLWSIVNKISTMEKYLAQIKIQAKLRVLLTKPIHMTIHLTFHLIRKMEMWV